jgi:hypothetical protein
VYDIRVLSRRRNESIADRVGFMNDAESLEFIKSRYPDQPIVWAAYIKGRRVMEGTSKLYQATKIKKLEFFE